VASGLKFTGAAELSADLNKLSKRLATNIGSRAVRAGIGVVAEQARANIRSSEYAEGLRDLSKTRGGHIRVKATRGRPGVRSAKIAIYKGTKRGDGSWFAHFFEFGTAPHDVAATTAQALGYYSDDGGGVFFGKRATVGGIRAIRFMSRAIESRHTQQKALDEMARKLREGIKRGS